MDLDPSEPLPVKELAEDFLARTLPPKGYEAHLIVRAKDFYYFKHLDNLQDGDEIAFYDGDMRDVLLPDDPRVTEFLEKL
ncbi:MULTISPECIES: hypothetical protein [unclassified Duganella]|uniref:hypothetical protein n=1 Tax=unclassified Duganella TaxID=2636909 RepID=UPI0006FBBE52|nr:MULTISPECIES: hypothetical protein [unclassified Duganella]KQV54800.1 hypothetical protein ASD07_29010 [Duganella sp. Root336D2]